MMKGILFEDLYKYTNKYWKDVKSRHVRPTTKTLADIAKASPDTYNRIKADLIPFPGDHLIEQLGSAFKNISDATYLINTYMGKFENKFLSLLKEDEFDDPVPAVDAGPEDDQQSFTNALDDPSTADEFEDVIDQHPNEMQELEDLQEWIGNIEDVIEYLNGGIESVLGKLRTDNKVGTIFADVSDATKSEVLDVCERLASLNQIFKNLYIEKHK